MNLPPTILELMGAPLPAHFDGSPMIRQTGASVTVSGALGRTGSGN